MLKRRAMRLKDEGEEREEGGEVCCGGGQQGEVWKVGIEEGKTIDQHTSRLSSCLKALPRPLCRGDTAGFSSSSSPSSSSSSLSLSTRGPGSLFRLPAQLLGLHVLALNMLDAVSGRAVAFFSVFFCARL